MSQSTVLITGASGGIGSATAVAYAERGWRTILCSRRRSPLEGVATDVSAAGGTPVVAPLDVDDESDVFWRLAETVESVVDVVVPAAATTTGPPGDRPLDEESYEAFDAVLATNVRGVFATVREALQFMPPDGRVLVPSGSVAREPVAGMGAYAVSKAAVEGIARGFAADVEQTVGVVDPGIVSTALTDHTGRDPESAGELFHWAGVACPADDLDGAIVDLAQWKRATSGD